MDMAVGIPPAVRGRESTRQRPICIKSSKAGVRHALDALPTCGCIGVINLVARDEGLHPWTNPTCMAVVGNIVEIGNLGLADSSDAPLCCVLPVQYRS